MSKLNIPMTLLLSSTGLLLLTVGSLLLASNLAHTSDVAPPPEVGVEVKLPSQEFSNQTEQSGSGSRRRSGRIYTNNSPLERSQQESYAAAYAAANAPVTSGESTGSDTSGFAASFGETPGQTAGSSAGAANLRQFQSTSADFNSAPAHSSYYANFMSPSSASYSASSTAGYPATSSYASQYQQQAYSKPIQRNPPTSYHHPPASYYDRAYLEGPPTPLWPSSSNSLGLMSSASSALSHWTGGFGISEIICAVVALAIGAVILGAPFFLIYLALMGNFSGSGTLSLTNPSSGGATGGATVAPAGRRKRMAIFEANTTLAPQYLRTGSSGSSRRVDNSTRPQKLSQLVDLDQLAVTFKRLVKSLEKFSNISPGDFGELLSSFSGKLSK